MSVFLGLVGLGLMALGYKVFRVQFEPGNFNRFLPPGARLLRFLLAISIFALGVAAMYFASGIHETKKVPDGRPETAALPATAGRNLILEANEAYPKRMGLGPVSQELYDRYRSRYGWEAPTLLDFCGELVAGSLERGATKEGLGEEFYAIRSIDPGAYLLITSGEITDRAGLTEEDFPPLVLDRAHSAIKNPADIVRFDTASLGDNVLFVWRFTVGYEYYRRYSEQLDPTPGEPESRGALTQEEIDRVLRSIRPAPHGG